MAIAPLPDPDLLDALTSTRPALRLLPIPGGGTGAADPVVHEPVVARRLANRPGWHRRIFVILAAGMLAALAAPVAALAGTGGASPHPVAGTTYVVQPGDTLRSIALSVDPGDPGPLIARMTAETGSATVVAGEHIAIP